MKQNPTEFVWEFDERFKILLDLVSFEIATHKYKEWFIDVILPHIRFPLSQQNIETEAEALKLVMKLEASPTGDTNIGMQKI